VKPDEPDDPPPQAESAARAAAAAMVAMALPTAVFLAAPWFCAVVSVFMFLSPHRVNRNSWPGARRPYSGPPSTQKILETGVVFTAIARKPNE
jgi:hypothetical protein